MSIKWKISLGFTIITLLIVLLYIVIAKSTFESDKISYIYSSQQKELSQYSGSLDQKITLLIFEARAILSGYDIASKTLNADATDIFNQHPHLLGVELINKADELPIVSIEKRPGLFAEWEIDLRNADAEEFSILPTDFGFIALQAIGGVDPDRQQLLRVAFTLPRIFNQPASGQTLILLHQDNVIISANEDQTMTDDIIADAVSFFAKEPLDRTSILKVGDAHFLASLKISSIRGFRLISLVREDHALGALKKLYHRSAYFLAFSFFLTAFLALFFSSTITRNLTNLKSVAEKIGAGDFSADPAFISSDETGVLANAFRRMKIEIIKLLKETEDRGRMEAELKTAGLVQTRLFPERKEAAIRNIELSGLYETTSETGGDWWYYFEGKSALYFVIADATGHGSPAALITSAIRAVFSVLEKNEPSLLEIASICDEAVFACSKGEMNMTALIGRIDFEKGECSFINASHEPPLKLDNSSSGDGKSEFLVMKPNAHLGKRSGEWQEHKFSLKPGETIILYTDGLTSSVDGKGNQLSDRKIMRMVETKGRENASPKEIIYSLRDLTMTHNEGRPLPDDLTLVSIKFGSLKV